jgi:hypothetical protein
MQNHAIRLIHAAARTFRAAVGTGRARRMGDDGLATEAQLYRTREIAVASDGSFSIAATIKNPRRPVGSTR